MKTTSYEFLILKLFGTKNNSIISCQKMVSIHQLISYLTCLLSILINIYNLWNTYIHWIYSILVYTHLRTHNILILLVGFQIDWWDRMEWQKENRTFMNRCLRELPLWAQKVAVIIFEPHSFDTSERMSWKKIGIFVSQGLTRLEG